MHVKYVHLQMASLFSLVAAMWAFKSGCFLTLELFVSPQGRLVSVRLAAHVTSES